MSDKSTIQADLDKVFYRTNQLRWRHFATGTHIETSERSQLQQLWKNGDGEESWREIEHVVTD